MTSKSSFSSCSSMYIRSAAVLPNSYPRQRRPGRNEHESSMCHQPEGRRRSSIKQHIRSESRSRPWKSLNSFMLTLILFLSVLSHCQQVEASQAHYGRRFDRRTERAELLIDRSEPPISRMQLEARKAASIDQRSSNTSSADPALQTATPNSPLPLPQPFDTNLGSNFTAQSCPAFFETFLKNQTFQDCLPFSLLLQVCVECAASICQPQC